MNYDIIFWEVHPSFKIDLILVKKFETLAISSRHNWLKLPTFFLMGPKRLHQCPHITIYAILCMQHKTPKLYSKARWYEIYKLYKYGEMVRYHFIEFLWNETNVIQARLLLWGKNIMRFEELTSSQDITYQKLSDGE